MISWKQWVDDASGAASARAVAARIGYSHTSVVKWFRDGKPPAPAVVAVARAYSADIVVGLVCAGIMSIDDVQRDVERRLQFVPTHLLLAELSRRGSEGTSGLKHGLAPEWDEYRPSGPPPTAS